MMMSCSWHIPLIGMIKLNTDGSFQENNDCMGGGDLMCDAEGH